MSLYLGLESEQGVGPLQCEYNNVLNSIEKLLPVHSSQFSSVNTYEQQMASGAGRAGGLGPAFPQARLSS